MPTQYEDMPVPVCECWLMLMDHQVARGPSNVGPNVYGWLAGFCADVSVMKLAAVCRACMCYINWSAHFSTC